MIPSHLFDPHHDGSPRYVLDQAPSLGDTVRVRVWVPHDPRPGACAPDGVWLRSVRDGEPFLVRATASSAVGAGTWWEAGLLVSNPVTSYRFLLRYGDSYRWLNGAGVHDRDVTDAGDFRVSTDHRLPEWVPDQVGYQVFSDRFARGGEPVETPDWAQPADWDDPVVHRGPDVPFQWFGGTLDGVREHLDHLSDLGATLLYLTPFFEARSNHRYDAASFDAVDPVLGGDAALRRLIGAAHDAGIRVVGDLTTNHTGETHPWFVAAKSDPSSEERGFYRIHDDGSYESWLGVPSLPKLDHGSAEMRRRLYEGPDSVVARWLRHGLDGWRIDVANMTGRLGADDHAHDVARTIRRTMAAERPGAWLLAEHGHDASLDLAGAGWHGTMDYAGFTRPVWSWLNGGAPSSAVPHGLEFLGLPVPIPVRPGGAVVAAVRDAHAAMPWQSRIASTSHLDSHDTPRFRTVAGGGTSGWVDAEGTGRERHLLGLALQMTLPGIPVVFMGDELGLTGVDGEHSRTPMPWERRGEWDEPTYDAYSTWMQLRREHVALRRGSLRWVHVQDDSLTYLREHDDQTLLVHVGRAAHPVVELPLAHLGGLRPLLGAEPVVRGGVVRVPGGAGAAVYVVS